MGTVDFLQEHHVGRHTAHCFAQLWQDETPVQRGKTFMRVDRQYREAAHGGEGWRRIIGGVERLGNVHGRNPSAKDSLDAKKLASG
ncbi:hypothetical protein D3C86_2098030 [compost metagenome]